ncbi:MAG: hypothetical protein ACLFP1_04600 [Candidatus Goldiibacteriota bacterium]
MIKKFLPVVLAVFIITAVSCRELSRTNPYDPAAENYIGITYYGEVLYPADLTIKKMLYIQDELIFAGKKNSVHGIVKGVSGTARGGFDAIYDICPDSTGKIYAVHNESSVAVMDTAGFFSEFVISADPGDKRMYIEHIDSHIFISSENESVIEKYSLSGAPAGAVNITATAEGYFKPGRLFTNGEFLYTVNILDKKQVMRLNSDLTFNMLIELSFEVKDGEKRGDRLQLLSVSGIKTADYSLNIEKTWGDFGEGPGRILNGSLIAVDESADPGVEAHTYVLDSGTLKKFGE